VVVCEAGGGVVVGAGGGGAGVEVGVFLAFVVDCVETGVVDVEEGARAAEDLCLQRLEFCLLLRGRAGRSNGSGLATRAAIA
jgi:hypothetical protein